MTVRDTVRRVRETPAVRSAAAVVLLGAALAGCGIRPTEVPTDFGPAPSRVPCAPSAQKAERAPQGVPVQVFLVCSSQLVAVDRSVAPDAVNRPSDRLRMAQALLDELEEPPSATEDQAGFTTDVRGPMTVGGPRDGDPDGTLRLSADPAGLTQFALSQLVCTYGHSELGGQENTVVLAGPAGTEPRRYECTEETRTRPGEAGPEAEAVD